MNSQRSAAAALMLAAVLSCPVPSAAQIPDFEVRSRPQGAPPSFRVLLDELRRRNHDLPPIEDRQAYRGRALEEFYFVESELNRWNDEYRRAPSGSWREREADHRRREVHDRGLRLVSSPSAMRGFGSAEIERFAVEMDQKYRAAPSGGLPESLYNAARRSAWQAFREEREEELRYERDWRRIAQQARESDARYRRAPSGSLEEAAFQSLRRSAWDAAFEAFSREVNRLSGYELDSLEREFDDGYRRAPSGSLEENFFRRVRDLVRGRLEYRPRW